MIRVERSVLLPPGIQGLRNAADAEGVRNMALLVDGWPTQRFDGPGEALFAAYDGETLTGVGGVTRETDAPAMRMRRLYVLPIARRQGAGRLLADAMIAKGFESADLLTCNARATPLAAPFWEKMGFMRVDAPGWTHELTRPA
jgi:GNAT superfamily N-acetyltransferase